MSASEQLAAIERESNAHKRALAMAALANDVARGDRELVPRLAKLLSGDPDPFVRGLSCRALARIGGDEAREALVAALGDGEQHVRESAWKALDPADDELAIPLLTRIVESRNPGPRAIALNALRMIAARAGGPVALPRDAIEAAIRDEDRYVRAAAYRAAAFLPDRTRARELVLLGLEDDEGWVRESAAHGAAEGFGESDRPAVAGLVDALAFAREDATRLHLLRALAAICARPAPEDRGLVGTARAWFTAADAGVRAAALLLVGVIAREADRGLADDLATRLADEREEIRAAAARLLGDLAPSGQDSLVPALERAASSTDANVRRDVARAARRVGTGTVERLLRKLCEDKELSVARAAAEGLSELLS